jgi:hypothetical protein
LGPIEKAPQNVAGMMNELHTSKDGAEEAGKNIRMMNELHTQNGAGEADADMERMRMPEQVPRPLIR